METHANAGYVVTLVHGTWSRRQGWTAPGLLLRRELEHRLPGVVIRTFPWSGANTHTARTRAGAGLAHFIRSGHARYPDARHFVIAHSHGGNVALYAMRDPAARAAISGIVTLATPFIGVTPRRFRRYLTAVAAALLAAPLVLLLVVLEALDLQHRLMVGLASVALLSARFEPVVSKWLLESGRRAQARIVAGLQPPAIEQAKLLILCPRRDEASRWLRMCDVVARAPFVLGGAFLAFIEWLSRSRLYGTLADGSFLGVGAGMVASGLLAACAACGVALMLGGVMRWPAYWREPLRGHLLVQVATSKTPRADSTSHRAHTFDVTRPSSRITHHGAICSNPVVVSAVLAWIAKDSRPDLPVG